MAEARGYAAGGILGLCRLLNEHGEAIEADLQRYYGTDLRDLFRPGSGLTWRRLRALVVNLPPDSALARTMVGPDSVWTLETQLLAAVHDRLSEANWQRGNAGSKTPSRRPQPISRPGVRSDRIGGTNRNVREVATYLARFHPDNGG